MSAIKLDTRSFPLHEATGQKWLPALLVSFYYFNLWTPPGFWIQGLTWYLVLGYALLVYLSQGTAFSYRSSRVFWSVTGLMVLGAELSLFRATNPDRVLWNTTGMLLHFASLFLFLPALSSPLTRRTMLITLLLAGLLWAFEIQRQLYLSGAITSHVLFRGKGEDKNYISLCLALAATMLAALAVLWKPPGILPMWLAGAIKMVIIFVSGYLAYSLLLIYSRSGVLVLIVGYCVILGLLLRQRYGLLRLLITLITTGILIGSFGDELIRQAPGWKGYLEISQFQTRLSLIQKTITIIQDNPFIGIGPDETKYIYPYYRETQLMGLPHNSFLKGWAECGIFGLAGYGVWMVAFLRSLINRFSAVSLMDRIWLLLMIPYFFMMMFLDLGGNSWFMLSLLAGMYEDRRLG